MRATHPILPPPWSRYRKRRARACGLALGLALTLAGCGSGGRSITLYNGQHVQTTDALAAAFERATGIAVKIRSDDEDTLADEIVTEGSSSPADVIYTENSPALEFLQERGLLAPVAAATLAGRPSSYNSPQGDWVGVSARVSVLIYNPSLISSSQLPRSVLELADHRFRGRLAFAAAETDFQPIVTSVARTYGEAAALSWLRAIASNAAGHVYPNNETIANEVNRGAVAFGVINQYYWYRLKAELGASGIHTQIAYFAPRDPGYVIDVSGAAVLRSSRHRGDAERFLAFLVSAQAQHIIARSQSFEYPLAPGIGPPPGERPFASLQPNPIDVAQLGDGSRALALLRKAGLL